jgi:hypothetical protein
LTFPQVQLQQITVAITLDNASGEAMRKMLLVDAQGLSRGSIQNCTVIGYYLRRQYTTAFDQEHEETLARQARTISLSENNSKTPPPSIQRTTIDWLGLIT